MMTKDILNIFQYDWAAAPTVEKEYLKPFKNSVVYICGNSLARALAYTFLTQNDLNSLNAKAVLSFSDKELENTVFQDAAEREDLIICRPGKLDLLRHAPDYIIYTGVCSEEITTDCYARETAALSTVLDRAGKNTKVVMLSDCRGYGKGSNKYRAFSENEQGYAGAEDFSAQLIRTLECTVNSICSEKGLNLTVLRPGLVLAPGESPRNGLEETFKAVAEGKDISLYSTENKLSLVYMSDVFGAVAFALYKKLSGTFNLAGKNCTVSTGLLCAKLHDKFGQDMKVKLIESGSFEGCELNCGKLKFAGFEPQIDLDTALELCVRSYKNDVCPDFRFPDEHEGRLDAIHQILLAYLLEVDRICKKHNIQWYLGGGTLLGAARHGGFIPWDDDVDIMMLREDYDKFLQVAAEELPEGMILQDPKKDKTYNYCYARLRIENTMFATDFSKNHKGMNNGFFFDIFCHDKTANSKIGQKLHSQLTLFWLAMVFNKWNHRRVYNGKKFQSAISNFCKNIFPLRFSMRMLLFTLEMFKHKKRARYLYDGMGKSVHKGGFDRTFLDGEIRLDLCGEKLPAPLKYKEYLTNHYGDYMALSPLSSRLMGHEITLVDLAEYADFRISNNPEEK